ncbi:MAG: hypothetical protein ACJ8CB_14420 [Ktedonobacteraceae bacterium]
MKQLVQRHPLLFATLLALTAAVFVPVEVRLAPTAAVPSLLALLDLRGALFAIVLLAALGWWGQAGFNRPRRWHALHILWLPVLLALIPLAEGIQVSDPLQTAVVGLSLFIGAFMGEALFRGIALRALLPTGSMRAVFLSSVLFGLVYTVGFFLGKAPLFALAQIMISASFGLCVAAVRLLNQIQYVHTKTTILFLLH